MFKRGWFRLPLLVSLALLATCASLGAQGQTHLVHIGGNGFQLIFTDSETQTNVTVVRPGDTVRWTWDYIGIEHSTTSGTCTGTFFGICTANGIWDSGFRFNPPKPPDFTRVFNDLGTFPYFCMLHGPTDGMRGKVVVLNGPDYQLSITDNSFSPPPIPTITVMAGQRGTFNGQLFGFLGYNSQVDVTCTDGPTRKPNDCPGTTQTPTLSGTSFNFSVSDSTAGDYTFNVTGTGNDPGRITHSQQVLLRVQDFNLTAPSPSSVTVLPGTTSSRVNFQLTAANGFSGFINFDCVGLPQGASCSFFQPPDNPFPTCCVFAQGFPVNMAVSITNNSNTPGTFPVQLRGTFFNFGNPNIPPVIRSQPLSVQLIGPATHYSLTAPSSAIANQPFDIAVTARDSIENVVTNHGTVQGTRTIHFTSSDAAANLPPNYTFQAADHGAHTFANGVTLRSIGPRTVTVADTLVPSIFGTTPIIRVHNAAPNVTVAVTSSRTPTSPPHFSPPSLGQEGTAVTFTATVSSNGAIFPDGLVRFFDGSKDIGTATLIHSSTQGQSTAVLAMDGVHLALRPGGHGISVVYEPSEGSGFTSDLSPAISQPRSPAPRCAVARCPGNER